MSKRRRRAPDTSSGAAEPREAPAPDTARGPRDRRDGRLLRDVLILVAAFGIGVGVAELLGAASLGVAFGVGQLVFAVVLVVLLTRD